jgi:hypothetical protein
VLVTNHALAGAGIGLLLRRPAAAFVAGAASHVAMDLCPHWGDTRLGWEEFVEVARLDGIVGLGVIAAVGAAAPPRHRLASLAGMAGAVAMDLDKPGRHFFGRSPFPALVDRFHRWIQTEAPAWHWVESAAAGVLAFALVSLLDRAGGSGTPALLAGGWRARPTGPGDEGGRLGTF